MVLRHGEKRGPFCQIMEIEVNIVVLGKGIEIGEIHVQEILWTKSAEGGHGGCIWG